MIELATDLIMSRVSDGAFSFYSVPYSIIFYTSRYWVSSSKVME